jgi:hypothetical protein
VSRRRGIDLLGQDSEAKQCLFLANSKHVSDDVGGEVIIGIQGAQVNLTSGHCRSQAGSYRVEKIGPTEFNPTDSGSSEPVQVETDVVSPPSLIHSTFQHVFLALQMQLKLLVSLAD